MDYIKLTTLKKPKLYSCGKYILSIRICIFLQNIYFANKVDANYTSNTYSFIRQSVHRITTLHNYSMFY